MAGATLQTIASDDLRFHPSAARPAVVDARSHWLRLILVASFALNVTGLGWGLPQRWHPDEIIQRAENMVGEPSLNPHFFVYGGLHHYVIAAFAVLPVKIPNKLFHLVDYSTQSVLVILLARFVSVLLGTATVMLVFHIGERLFDRQTGLVAAALLATSMLLVNLSHFATVDVPSLFWFLLSGFMATEILCGGRRRTYLLAGLCVGLAASVKYVGGVAFCAVAAAHFVAGRRPHTLLAVAAAGAIGGFLLGNPVLLFAPLEFLEGFLGEMHFAAARGMGLPRAFLPLVIELKDALGLPVFLLSCGGFLYALALLADKHVRPAVLLVFSMAVPYYLAVGLVRGPRAGPLLGPLPPLRYVLPLIPFLLLLAAKLLHDLLNARRNVLHWTGAICLTTALSSSALYAAAVDLQTVNDSRYVARRWIVDNVKAGAVIETTSYGPDLPDARYTLIERPHDNRIADVAAAVRETDERLHAAITRWSTWFSRLGFNGTGREYVPWYRKSLAVYDKDLANFDISTTGLESRAPDVVVISDLYFLRFAGDASPEGAFFDDLLAGHSAYELAAAFHYDLPAWLEPATEFLNPHIFIFVPRRHQS